MSDKLVQTLAPTSGHAGTAAAIIATIARGGFVVFVRHLSLWQRFHQEACHGSLGQGLQKVFDDVPDFRDEDDLKLLGDWSNKKYTFV